MSKGVFYQSEWPTTLRGSRGTFDPAEIIKKLMANPGVGHVIAEDVSASFTATSPKIKALKDAGCEVTSALGKNPSGDEVRMVWARYAPEAVAEAEQAKTQRQAQKAA